MITAAIMFAVIVPVMLLRLLRKQKKAIDDFDLVIDEDTITLYPSLPGTLIHSLIEVTQIIKNSDGSFIIIGNANKTVINIPADVEHAERLEARLAGFAPITANSQISFVGRHIKVIVLAVVFF